MPPDDEPDGLALVRFAQAVGAASSLDQLDRIFLNGFGRLIDVSMYGFNLVDPRTDSLEHNTSANVSEVFHARYTAVMDQDPLRAHALSSGQVVYNRAMMSEEEWEDSAVYRSAYSVHG